MYIIYICRTVKVKGARKGPKEARIALSRRGAREFGPLLLSRGPFALGDVPPSAGGQLIEVDMLIGCMSLLVCYMV